MMAGNTYTFHKDARKIILASSKGKIKEGKAINLLLVRKFEIGINWIGISSG